MIDDFPPQMRRLGDTKSMKIVKEVPAVQSYGAWGWVVSSIGAIYSILSLTGVVPPGLEGPITVLVGNVLGGLGAHKEGPVTSILPKG